MIEPSHTEVKTIEFELDGSDLTGEPISQSIYNFDLKIDELAGKPAFMVNTTTQILFPSNDRVLLGCFVAYFFDDPVDVPTADSLWKLVEKAVGYINSELESLSNRDDMSIQAPDQSSVTDQLRELVLSGFRLN